MRPYLNDERQLMFLHCSEFVRFPSLQFILNESMKALELRESQSTKKVFIQLKGENEEFYHRAIKVKQEIMNLLRQYTHLLQTGKEKVLVFETGFEECPYYFISHTTLDHGIYSIKFEKGFMYFINEKYKNEDNKFTDFMEMQKFLSAQFQKIDKERFKTQQNGETFYEMTFKDLLNIA